MPYPLTTSVPSADSPDALWLPLEATTSDTAVSVILKLRGETCDIDCLYCFEKRKEAPGGAAITPSQVRRLSRIFGERPLAVELHGGEPLTIGRTAMAALLDELAAQPTVTRVQLQTNGLRLDEQWLDLFEAHYPTLTIGISLDGDEHGNSWRVGYDGQPVYPRITASLDLLAARSRTCGIVTAVTPAVLGRAQEVIDHIASFTAVRAINLVPAFDATIVRTTASAGRRPTASRLLQQQAVTRTGPAWAVTPREYADFTVAATARWIAAGHFQRIKLDPAVATIRRLRGLDTAHCHFSTLKCSHVFTAYPDGRLGSCDELPWPEAHLLPLTAAHTEADITAAQDRSPLLAGGQELMAKCTACPYRATCGGGCTATRWRMYQATGNDDAYCDHRARIIDGIAALLAAPDQPATATCERARWRPRIPNEMHDADAFLARWDDPAAPRGPARLHTSDHGNINSIGLPDIHPADDLDPLHPRWRESIEPGVWPLVDTLTTRWQAVTYDSCQGHHYAGTDIDPAAYRVGLLPRNRAEYAALAARLCRTIANAEGYLPRTVTSQLAHTDLTSTATGARHPVLEISLIPTTGTPWCDYFADLDQAARVLTHAARHTDPDGGCGCALRPPRSGMEER
ncbi:radical SAM/SPASM domain-containing protein [Candidatus Protofrankia californiensis]|uniref:radical SAM/SPASM domain-containing protein n=1 Tax=Candidatus Protofrankia californiensis TaxID=1839754 RepID=UPI0010410D99|nr:radical SAM protein [Candidatus Protofrankia californiensis]